MNKIPLTEMEDVLRDRLNSYLCNCREQEAPLAVILNKIKDAGGKACLFGGILRDAMIYGLRDDCKYHNDIDIVVDRIDDDTFYNIVKCYERGKLKGKSGVDVYRIVVKEQLFDLWTISDAWVFNEEVNTYKLEPTFPNLAKMPFLSTEAISVELSDDCMSVARINDNGFFQSIHDGVVGLNCSSVHCVNKNVIRALCVAYKHGLPLSQELVQFCYSIIIGDFMDGSDNELIDYQDEHYGGVYVNYSKIANIKQSMKDWVDSPTNSFKVEL